MLNNNSNRTSKVWNYYGNLELIKNINLNIDKKILDYNYCNLCFTNDKVIYLKNITLFSSKTSTSNLKPHLINHHNIKFKTIKQFEETKDGLRIKLNKNLVLMLCLDDLLFNLVNKTGFKLLIEFIENEFEIKLDFFSNSHLTRHILPQIYNKALNHVKNKINNELICGCISIDG